MGYYEALRRALSQIMGREVGDDDPALFKLIPKGHTIPANGTNLFKHAAFTPFQCPPGYEYYTDASGNMAVKCKHNTSGAMTVTEASAANISSQTNVGAYCSKAALPSIMAFSFDSTVSSNRQTRIGRAVITCDGAGAYANYSLVAALAGYYGVVKILSVKANAGVAAGAGTFTFESPAGTAALPSLEVCPALVANTRNRDWLDGTVITHATLVDNQAIVVDLAGWGAATIVEIFYEYWYET